MTRHALVVFFLMGGARTSAQSIHDAGSHCALAGPISGSSATGLTAEAGFECQAYGSGRTPWVADHALHVGYAFGPGGIVGNYTGTVRPVGGSPIWSLHIDGASAEYSWFYGIGNETGHPLGDHDYRAREARVVIAPSIAFQPVSHLTVSLGPEIRYRDAERFLPRYFAETQPYGSGQFGVVDGRVSAVYDTRDPGYVDSSGFRIEVSGRNVPGAWDALHAYGTGHAEVAGYTKIPGTPLTINLRAGGDKVWGVAPYQDLAHVGGAGTVRAFFPGRFSGNAAAYQESELFLALGRFNIIAPSTVGILGLNDVGRVSVPGEHSSTWHDGYGGGVWGSFLDRRYFITAVVAHSVEFTEFDAGFGFGW